MTTPAEPKNGTGPWISPAAHLTAVGAPPQPVCPVCQSVRQTLTWSVISGLRLYPPRSDVTLKSFPIPKSVLCETIEESVHTLLSPNVHPILAVILYMTRKILSKEARQRVDLSGWAKTSYQPCQPARHIVKYLATRSLCVRPGHVSVTMLTSSAVIITRYRDRPKRTAYRSLMVLATVVITRPTWYRYWTLRTTPY